MIDASNVRVLLVEDDPADADIFRRYASRVEKYEMDITHVEDADAAQQKLSGGQFDLVFLDHRLDTAETGLDILQSLNPDPADTPVIILTGTGDEELAAQSMKAGASDYLVKSALHSHTLGRSVHHALEEQRLAAERRRSKEKLRRSEARFRTLFEAIPDLVLVYDDDGTILHANDASAEELEYSEDELVGMALGEIIARDEASRIYEHIGETRRRGSCTFERTYISRTGDEVEAEVHERTMEFNGREAILSVARDITGPRRAEQKIENTNQQLEEIVEELRSAEEEHIEQERRRALTQMASGIAHDFNNSLSTVRGFAELLLQNPEKLKDPDTVKSYLRNIQNAANSAAETVRRMRKFYRPGEKRSHQRLDLNSVVEEAISMTEPRWQHEGRAHGKSIDVKLELEDVPEINGNESELHEMLTNLIFNAVDAINENGKITLSTRKDADRVVLAVEDTGQGMDEETLENCLNPFYTTKGESGTGLGLSVTQGIVRRHDGTLNIESELGQGTTFNITFPTADEETKEEDCTEGREAVQQQEVLIVEDDPSQRKVMARMLESEGHLVDLAADGKQGLQKFDNDWYSLVITDRAMPELNGDQLAQLIKERVPTQPVVMVTGFGDMMDAADECPEGVDLLLSKPISMEKVKNMMSHVT